VYDDFAHHPSAIATTFNGLRKKVGEEKIIAVIEPRSNTMRMGVHAAQLADSVANADHVLWFDPPSLSWDIDGVIAASKVLSERCNTLDDLIARIVNSSEAPCHIVIMSNGGFGGVHGLLIDALNRHQ
jgi:UDP-N-acetylmuramate: L-alanyl-gamma-D-glutamyl-meso-diaminopimelate ligase